MWLVVGLGNPGSEYALTRHNFGFMAADYWLKSLGGSHWSQEHKALVAKFKFEGQSIILAKPQTFMNRSGESVQSLLNFYKIDQQNLIVAHDEVDQNFGQMKIQKNRGHGGNNGIRDISEKLGNNDYIRLRLGVGRPVNPNIPMADYVLSGFSKEEQTNLGDVLEKACDAIESIILEGHQKASTKFNS